MTPANQSPAAGVRTTAAIASDDSPPRSVAKRRSERSAAVAAASQGDDDLLERRGGTPEEEAERVDDGEHGERLDREVAASDEEGHEGLAAMFISGVTARGQ